MSLWPRLRKRSKGRKRSSAKPNPYSSVGLDKLAVMHAEFDAQRAQFAAEKGVPVSSVRFLSGSARGWTLLPPSAISPSREEDEDDPSSTSSTASSSPERRGRGLSPRPCLRPSQRISSSKAVSEAPVHPPIPYPSGSEQAAQVEAPSSSTPSDSGNAEDSVGGTGIRDQVVEHQRSGKEQARNNNPIRKVSMLLVGLGVFSTGWESNTLFALVVSFWERGKSFFKRLFSILITHLIPSIRPLSLSDGSVMSMSSSSVETGQMNVSAAATLISPILPSRETDALADGRGSNFEFPVLLEDSPVSTPIFPAQQNLAASPGQQNQQVQATVDAGPPTLRPVVTSVKVVAVSSQPGSPAFEGSKGCQKLKSRIFNCNLPRKITPPGTENSITEADAAVEGAVHVETPTESQATEPPRMTDSPHSVDSPRCKRLSFIKRRSKCSTKGTKSEDHSSGQSTAESELEDISSPVTRVVTVKSAKSPEVLTSRNPNSDADSVGAGKKKASRSQELRFSLKNLKKNKSQEIYPTSAKDQDGKHLALEVAALKDLQELAFPFKHETDPSKSSTRTSPGSKADKKRSGRAKLLLCDSDGSEEGSVSSSQGNKTITAPKRISKSVVTSPVSKSRTEKSTIIDYRPELRKVKTAVGRAPLPAEPGELARSPVLDREILGALLVLTVLAFLLLGKIPAILGTACLCLVLSHVQTLLSHNVTPRQMERLAASRTGAGGLGLSRLGGTGVPQPYGLGTTAALDVQSSEYRKKVLIDGFLDRGNRRMA